MEPLSSLMMSKLAPSNAIILCEMQEFIPPILCRFLQKPGRKSTYIPNYVFFPKMAIFSHSF